MKISFSLSPSSSSTSSFDPNFTNSQNATPSCLSSILRRFLCTGSLPTHPSDCIQEPDTVESDHQKDFKTDEKIEAPATPGIVARLMGLDSMPDLNLVSTGRTPDSIGRSRSVNSVDYWSEFDPMQVGHRRVRTSLSFRETPTYLQLENDEFLLLSFENAGESKELRSKGRKSEMGFGELKQRRPDRSKNREKSENRREQRVPEKKKEDQERNKTDSNKRDKRRPSRKVVNCDKIKDSGSISPHKKEVYRKPRVASKSENLLKPTNHKEVSDGAKLRKKKKNRAAVKKVEPECTSENSSPVSVLDLGDFLIEPETLLAEEHSRQTSSNSRRKLSPDLTNSDSPSRHFTRNLITESPELRLIDGKDTESIKTDSHTQGYLEVWGEICKLAEEDMKTSNWKMEDLEELGIECGLQIVDRLLHEVVTELAGFPMKNIAL